LPSRIGVLGKVIRISFRFNDAAQFECEGCGEELSENGRKLGHIGDFLGDKKTDRRSKVGMQILTNDLPLSEVLRRVDVLDAPDFEDGSWEEVSFGVAPRSDIGSHGISR
jgi:hypothetical protein